jgi:hypothetical protein
MMPGGKGSPASSFLAIPGGSPFFPANPGGDDFAVEGKLGALLMPPTCMG